MNPNLFVVVRAETNSPRSHDIVGESRDGREAIRAIEKFAPDLVFLDVQMPELGGFEVLAGDRLYLPNKNADVFVLRASLSFECLTTNSIGGEPMNASLAVSEGEIFIRTDEHFWCVGKQ